MHSLDTAKASLHHHSEALNNTSLSRHALIDDLADLSDSLVSHSDTPSLLDSLESLQRRLTELTHLRSYVLVLRNAMLLSEKAADQLRHEQNTVSRASLSAYEKLLEYTHQVQTLCNDASSQTGEEPLVLHDFLENLRIKTWNQLKSQLSS